MDDTEPEILCEKVEPQQREPRRIRVRENTNFELAGRNPAREGRVAVRLEPEVDHRFDGIPTEVVNHDQARQEATSHLIRPVLRHQRNKN